MKSTYLQRNKHERFKQVKKNFNEFAQIRRKRALERLRKQLETNTKRNKQGELVKLTEQDIERISYNIEILKERIGVNYEIK